MLPLLPFSNGTPAPAIDPGVFNVSDLPKEMEIYVQTENDFLPPGKTMSDLTPDELETLRQRYRFSFFRPGIYQGITGKGDCI